MRTDNKYAVSLEFPTKVKVVKTNRRKLITTRKSRDASLAKPLLLSPVRHTEFFPLSEVIVDQKKGARKLVRPKSRVVTESDLTTLASYISQPYTTSTAAAVKHDRNRSSLFLTQAP